MNYTKDTGKYLNPVNFSRTYHMPFTNTTLSLLNSYSKPVYKDKGGEYVYDATSFDEAGNVSFTKRYRK